MFFSDGIPIIYAGQEQHYSGGSDPYNREATWLSGYSTTAELYEYIATTNQIRSLAISLDSSYVTSQVCVMIALAPKRNLILDRMILSTLTVIHWP